ncbi:MAG TPA: hypothetical protein VGF89_02915 [Steroidobacteraceae bacterium]
MTPRAAEFARRRGVLQLRCTAQRIRLAGALGVIEQDLHKVEHGLSVVKKFSLSPLVLAGGILALGLGAGRSAGFLSRAFLIFDTVQRIRRTLAHRSES